MMCWQRQIWLLGLGCLLSWNLQAEIFKYVDASGRLYYTDKPMSAPYRLVKHWASDPSIPTSGQTQSASVVSGNLQKKKAHYAALIQTVAQQAQISPELLHAVVQAESSYNSKAKSHAGAMGLMQLMPATAKRYSVANIWDPKSNLTGGAHYLRDLLQLFGQNLQLALAAYNAGENAVKKYGNQIPPYPETKNYVRKVLRVYQQNLAKTAQANRSAK